MKSGRLQSRFAATLVRKLDCFVNVMLAVSFAVFFSTAQPAHALFPGTGQPDYNNTYKNVGIYMFTRGGEVPAYCSGVLIHERVFMTAAHCAGWHVNGVAPFLRMVVSFSPDDPRDPSTWIDTTAHLVHPTFPYQGCVDRTQGCPPGMSDFQLARSPLVDIGLVVLARPVTDIVPATLARVGEIGGTGTVVGYGCEPIAVRNFGTGTVAELSESVAWYNHDPATQCHGDSGGPTFHNDRVASVVSGGDGRSFRFRVDREIVLDWIAAVIASLEPVAEANYQGLWWNASESGWGINLAHQGHQIYLTWYTYDATGKALWLAMLAAKTSSGSYSGDILELRGPPFSAMPFVPAPTPSIVGSGTLTFSDASNGTFAYTAKGVTQTKSLTRFVFGAQPTCTYGAAPSFAGATNYQDLWWNPAKSGWGINLAHQGSQIYATWYTYDIDGSPLWLASLMSAGAGGTYAGALLRFTGPAFSAVPYPPSAAPTAVGDATLTFANGNAATWSYTVGSTSGSEPMSRFLFATPAGTVCR